MEDKLSKPFGYVIAFLAPGLLGLWAASYGSTTIRASFAAVATADTSVGGFLFLTVAALGVGVFVTGVSHIVFECCLWRWKFLRVEDRADSSIEANRLLETEPAYLDIRDQHYRFYQFYVNTAVAIFAAFIAWAWATLTASAQTETSTFIVRGAFLFVAEAVLLFSARDALNQFRRKKRSLLQTVSSSGVVDLAPASVSEAAMTNGDEAREREERERRIREAEDERKRAQREQERREREERERRERRDRNQG